MKPNLPPIHCAVAPIDILLYVTRRHYRHYHSDCEQHYWYIINDSPRTPQFRQHPARIPRNELPHILDFTNSPHPAFYMIPQRDCATLYASTFMLCFMRYGN